MKETITILKETQKKNNQERLERERLERELLRKTIEDRIFPLISDPSNYKEYRGELILNIACDSNREDDCEVCKDVVQSYGLSAKILRRSTMWNTYNGTGTLRDVVRVKLPEFL